MWIRRGFFPGVQPERPLGRETIQTIVARAAQASGVTKRVCPHLLRHTFSTHLLKSRVDLDRIQRILGHSNLTTTTVYLHVASEYLGSVVNPLDLLPDSTKGGAV
ncbi:MAG: tyrosine-type recombinase/integrase [Planctomycetota bacterium]